MKGSKILVNGNAAKGARAAGVAYTAGIYPGTFVKPVAGVAPDAQGRLSWEAVTKSAVTDPAFKVLVLDDPGQGKTFRDAYAIGSDLPLYITLPGDQANLLAIGHASGTGDSVAVGDRLQIDTSNGCLDVPGTSTSSEKADAMALENLAAIAQNAYEWIWCYII